MTKKTDLPAGAKSKVMRFRGGRRSLVVAAATPAARNHVVSFGEVKIEGPAPDKVTVERNIAAGNSALKRAVSALAKPGIKLPRKAGVPFYWASSDDPNLMIRELNGRREQGAFIGGKFEVKE